MTKDKIFGNSIPFLIVLQILFVSFCDGQNLAKEKNNYFGFQLRPLVPLSVVGDRPIELNASNFYSTLSPSLGYSYGGVVRIGFSQLLAIETGLNYTNRNYNISYEVPDSSLQGIGDLTYTNFDIPVNFLVYIKLSEKFYMNSSLGLSMIYYPSNVRTVINPFGKHQFIFEGRRASFFSLDLNSNIGFEYRTSKMGYFYIGASGKIPFSPVLKIASEYRYDTEKNVAFGEINGFQLALDIKYFFPYVRSKGSQFKTGPIEQ